MFVMSCIQEVDIQGKGRGVIARRCFQKDELLCEYTGKLLNHSQAMEAEKEYSSDDSAGCFLYFFKFKDKSYW